MKSLEELKLYISVDIEGVAGICNWQETELGEAEYQYFRQEMIQETVTCCNTLLEMGIKNITVRDAHDSARNIIPNLLPKEVNLIRGWTEAPCDMMAGLDATYDGVILIGYHSPSRNVGNPLSHTLTTSLNHIKINGKIVSEFLLNTYYGQTQFQVPTILVCGDQQLTEIVKEENKAIETVATNIGMHGAIMARHPEVVKEDIQQKTKKAVLKLLENHTLCYITIPKHFETEIHFRTHKRAYRASFYPGVIQYHQDKTTHFATQFLDSLKFISFTE